MSTEQNKVNARHWHEAFGTKELPAMYAEYLAPDFVAHFPGVPGPLNREAYIQFDSMFAAAFSDNHITIEDQIAEGDKVVSRLTWRAVHTGDFQSIPPTSKQIMVTGVAIERFKDGKVVEHWAYFDQMGMMQQLGVVPAS